MPFNIEFLKLSCKKFNWNPCPTVATSDMLRCVTLMFHCGNSLDMTISSFKLLHLLDLSISDDIAVLRQFIVSDDIPWHAAILRYFIGCVDIAWPDAILQHFIGSNDSMTYCYILRNFNESFDTPLHTAISQHFIGSVDMPRPSAILRHLFWICRYPMTYFALCANT